MINTNSRKAHRVNTTDDNMGGEGFIAFIQNDTEVSRNKVADLKSTKLAPMAPWPEFADTQPSVPHELHIPRRRSTPVVGHKAKRFDWFVPFFSGSLIGFAITLIALAFAVA